MEFIALIQDSTDEDSDNGKSNSNINSTIKIKINSNSNSNGSSDQEITRNEKKIPPEIKAKEAKKLSSPSNTIHKGTATSATNGRRRSKARRKGSVDVVSSKEAQVSGVFSRSVPHRRGHWAGHVKIPILTTPSLLSDDDDDDDDLEVLRKLKVISVEASRNFLERHGISGTMVEHDDLHLSLSKHFSLQIAHIEPFVQRLGELLLQEPGTSIRVDTAWGSYQELSGLTTTQGNDRVGGGSIDEIVLLNEEKTRSFFCWSVRPTATLGRIVSRIDAVLKRYNQPVYYDPAHFHISFASFPGNIIETLNKSKVAYSHSGSDDDCSAARDLWHYQSSSNRSLDFSSAAASTSKNETKGDDDDDDSSWLEESFVLPVRELHCTLGTTKEFVMPLRTCRQL
mmetsp:Transcript_23721/g.51857  ORF Transcript_23721/g.51857 Transcript_23721/m.51857 type:complete len:397 (-) Transcript_23721:68-1258(-)